MNPDSRYPLFRSLVFQAHDMDLASRRGREDDSTFTARVGVLQTSTLKVSIVYRHSRPTSLSVVLRLD
jgi:hypothetical protein